MGRFVIGEVVVTNFPFSDLKGRKRRPALIVAKAEFEDLILCQITSKPYSSSIARKLSAPDFIKGGLPVTSYIRPDKLFTADQNLIERQAGELHPVLLESVLSFIRSQFTIA